MATSSTESSGVCYWVFVLNLSHLTQTIGLLKFFFKLVCPAVPVSVNTSCLSCFQIWLAVKSGNLERQTLGKGRGGRSSWSKKLSLSSVLLQPHKRSIHFKQLKLYITGSIQHCSCPFYFLRFSTTNVAGVQSQLYTLIRCTVKQYIYAKPGKQLSVIWSFSLLL